MARRPDVSKQGFWLELIRCWRRAQLSVREFCQRHHVSEASFFCWRRVLRDRGLLDEPMTVKTAKVSARAPTFVKLTTRDADPTVRPIELVLSPRRMLRVSLGFDADMLLQLVRLLEEPAC